MPGNEPKFQPKDMARFFMADRAASALGITAYNGHPVVILREHDPNIRETANLVPRYAVMAVDGASFVAYEMELIPLPEQE